MKGIFSEKNDLFSFFGKLLLHLGKRGERSGSSLQLGVIKLFSFPLGPWEVWH